MPIKCIGLKNFTVFEDFRLEVSSGINVFVGENGTGKTHLLKALYAACEITKDKSLGANFLGKCFKNHGSVDFFKNDKNRELDVYLKADCNNKEYIAVILTVPIVRNIKNVRSNVASVLSSDKTELKGGSYHIHLQENVIFDATFIPCKDMLTHSDGLPAMADKYKVPFDKTLTNIISTATNWTLNDPPDIAIRILPVLEKMLDGKIIFDHGEFIVQKKDGRMINFAVEAEGFKKVGLLWQLLMNGSISEDSILIWDEPEANLNPKFLPYIVECLLELSRHGVQIFLSTHNYIFAKYFNVRAKDSDSLMFHALYLENGNVQVESNKIFSSLKNNAIMQTFDQLLEEVYNLDMGD